MGLRSARGLRLPEPSQQRPAQAEGHTGLRRRHTTGNAVVRGDLTEGADSIATRIMNSEGHVVAALSVVVRTGSVRQQTVLPSVLPSVLPAVLTSGLGVSRMLGWRPGVRPRED